jgi:GTP cyclohydrolase IA
VDVPRQDRLEALCRDLLMAIGEDPDREGLADTPKRWAAWWREFIAYDPGNLATTFDSVETDQMVIVSGIRVYSLCEHHLLPFWCDVAIGYVTAGRVLGLSKFARIAHKFAHRLQVQERLTQQIADAVSQLTGSRDVAVIARGEHACMSTRGVRTPALMTSSVMRGAFRNQTAARAEFLQIASLGRSDT